MGLSLDEDLPTDSNELSLIHTDKQYSSGEKRLQLHLHRFRDSGGAKQTQVQRRRIDASSRLDLEFLRDQRGLWRKKIVEKSLLRVATKHVHLSIRT